MCVIDNLITANGWHNCIDSFFTRSSVKVMHACEIYKKICKRLHLLFYLLPSPSLTLHQGKEEEMADILKSLREPLKPTAHVSVARVLAAKSDLLSVQRTNTGRERAVAKCDINKVLIGKV